MGPSYALIVVYCVLIVGASLGGGWLPSLLRLTHASMQMIVSFVAGLMLGVGLFHLLPHAVVQTESIDQAVWWTMVGLLAMFFLIRTFHFHQHGPAETQEDDDSHHAHDHDRDHKLSWVGVAIGLAVHTFIDGVALAASVKSEANDVEGFALFGLATFLAILLHKPLDAMSITSLMVVGGWSHRWRQAINAGFAMMCPLGAALFFVGVEQFADAHRLVVGCALGFSAGVFLCISLSDLLPEVQFHSHDRFKLSAALLLGVALAYGIGFLEPEHAHGEPEAGHRSVEETHDYD